MFHLIQCMPIIGALFVIGIPLLIGIPFHLGKGVFHLIQRFWQHGPRQSISKNNIFRQYNTHSSGNVIVTFSGASSDP